MKTKRYLVITVMVGASIIVLQTRLAMADANRALQKAKTAQKISQKMPPNISAQPNAHKPAVMTEELSQLVATLAAAANPDDHKETVTQVVAGDLEKNELYIFGEQDVIPEEIIKEHPNAAIAVMGGDDANAIKKIQEFKKQAIIVAEKVNQERARIAADDAKIAAGLKRSIGSINRETLYPGFDVLAAHDQQPDHKQKLIKTVLASRTVLQVPVPAVVTAPVVKSQTDVVLANREFPKEQSMQERIHQQRYRLSAQLAINEIPVQPIPELPSAMVPKPVIQLGALEWPKAVSVTERIHRERYQLHIQAGLTEALLGLDKEKLEFDHGQYPLNVATVMSALHPAQKIQDKVAAQRFAFQVRATLSQALIAFTQNPIVFPVYVPHEVQGLSIGKAMAYLKQNDTLHHRLEAAPYSLPPIHAALNKSLVDFAEHSTPIVIHDTTGLAMEKVRVALKREALSHNIEINSRFKQNQYALPLTARLDHHLPAFAMYSVKGDAPIKSETIKQPAVMKQAVTPKKTIQMAQVTKKVMTSHAKAIARVERELTLGSEEPRPVVIRQEAYPEPAQQSAPRVTHQEPARVAEQKNMDAPRKKLPWRKIETPPAQERRHHEENPFNIASMDDDMRSDGEAAERSIAMRVEPDNFGSMMDD